MQIPAFVLSSDIYNALLDRSTCYLTEDDKGNIDPNKLNGYTIEVIPNEQWRSNIDYYFNTVRKIIKSGNNPNDCEVKASATPIFSYCGFNRGKSWVKYSYEITDKNGEMTSYHKTTIEISFVRNKTKWVIEDMIVRP